MAGAAGSRTAGAVTPEGLSLKRWTEERAQVRCARARELTGAGERGLTGERGSDEVERDDRNAA